MKAPLILDMIRAHYSGYGFDESVERLAEDEDRKGNSGLALEIRKACKGIDSDYKKDTGEVVIDYFDSKPPGFITLMKSDVKLSEMTLDANTVNTIKRIALENKSTDTLPRGVSPTNRILMVGPPGCGKTMAAKALAFELGQPLAYLRLDTLISMYMGRTGQNVGEAFDYALRTNCILFIDEFDAVAIRRDCEDIGESKRIVGAILQNMDLFPDVMVIAATNLSDAIDPAISRRFDRVIKMELPNEEQREHYIGTLFDEYLDGYDYDRCALVKMTINMSYADIKTVIFSMIRDITIQGLDAPLDVNYFKKSLEQSGKMPTPEVLRKGGMSLREVEKLTGISKSTLSRRENKKGCLTNG